MSFRRERYVPAGGPDGGDGGHGADVVLVADVSLSSLSAYRDRRSFRAPAGRPGAGAMKAGRDGEELVLPVPPGTVVSDADTGEPLADLVAHAQRVVAAEGGRGGRGNARFKGPTRQAPRIGELGEPGRQRRVHLELRLIADIGLVGLPNAGKSTLLAALTGARPRIGDYPFTTLSPNLGVAELEGGVAVVLADVPGLIEGAHRGAGLGLDFLRHLERTRVLLHVVDAAAGEAAAETAMSVIGTELGEFGERLAAKPRLLVLNKCDVEEARVVAALLRERHPDAYAVSAATGEGCRALLDDAGALVVRLRVEAAAASAASTVAVGPGGHRLYRHRPHRDAVAPVVSREGDAWRVAGTAAERAVSMTDMQSEEGVARLQTQLRRLGVDDALRAAGVREGDDVRLGTVEFSWLPDAGDVAEDTVDGG